MKIAPSTRVDSGPVGSRSRPLDLALSGNQTLIVRDFENALALKQGDDLISNLIGFLLGGGEVAEFSQCAQLRRFNVAVDVPALALTRRGKRSVR